MHLVVIRLDYGLDIPPRPHLNIDGCYLTCLRTLNIFCETTKHLGVGANGKWDLSARSVPMKRVVQMMKAAKTKDDALFLLNLLEGKTKGVDDCRGDAADKEASDRPWLLKFAESGGLGALAALVCDDSSIPPPAGESGSGSAGQEMKHPGVIKDSMLPRVVELLGSIDFAAVEKAYQKAHVLKMYSL